MLAIVIIALTGQYRHGTMNTEPAWERKLSTITMKSPSTLEFLHSYLNRSAEEWERLQGMSIPADVQSWLDETAERQRDFAVVWSDIQRADGCIRNTVHWDSGMGWSALMGVIVALWDFSESEERDPIFRTGTALLRLLLAAGESPDAHEPVALYGGPLHCACCYGNEEIAELLLRYGADANKQDADGWTPLHWSVRGNHVECARLLLAAGANPHIADVGGMTAADWAQECKASEMQALLSKAMRCTTHL